MHPATEIERAPEAATPESSSLEEAIEALVDFAHTTHSFAAFYRNSLAVIASCLRCSFVEAEIRHAGTIIQERHSRGSVDPAFWEEITQEALVHALAEPGTCLRVFVGRELELSVALLTAPIGMHGRRGGALAAIFPFTKRSQLRGVLDKLDVLCSLVSSLADSVENEPEPAVGQTLEEMSRIRKVASFTSEVELAYAITNKLRTRDGCVQVAMASVTNSRAKLLSVSGLDDIAPRSPAIKNLRMAMQECVDLRVPVVDQVDGLEAEGVLDAGRLHRQWRTEIGDASVASLPLFAGEELVAVISLQRVQKAPFSAEDLDEIRVQVEPYAAGLEMVRVARRPFSTHLRDALHGTLASLLKPGAWGRKLALVGATVFGFWSVFGSISYSINAPCALSPLVGRHVAAADDGVLIAIHAEPGDHVRAGDLLCEFETSELLLEAARLRGELASFDVTLYRALGESAAADAEYIRASARAVQANLDFVNHRIASARVVAPVDGVLLDGDHRSRIGDTYTKGETLYRIAESDSWKLEIRVPERDVDLLRIGAEGTFASHSRPGARNSIRILRLSPTAELHEGKNVFTAEASCEMPESWARSGMEGFASIDAGERSPAWVAGHRLLDFLRMHLWL